MGLGELSQSIINNEAMTPIASAVPNMGFLLKQIINYQSG
jgi:hypothetical protein